MTLDELEKAKRGAGTKLDRRRLQDGYEALRICTLNDLPALGVRDVEGRRKVLLSGIEAMGDVGDCGPEGNRIAVAAYDQLEARLAAYDEWIKAQESK